MLNCGVHYIGKFTGRLFPLEKWKVNDKGLVPSYNGPGPSDLPLEMTDQLSIVNY